MRVIGLEMLFLFSFQGLGLEILKETLCMCNPHVVVQLTDAISASQAREQMPDVTLEWLLKQPVFVPYRVSF